MSRAAHSSVSESASMCWIAWNAMIGSPNCTRSFANAVASSISRSAAPQHRAAIIRRS